MKFSRSSYLALAIVASASNPHFAMANVGPCAKEITDFRQSLSRNESGEPIFVATAPQSIDAQLQHQPTKASVERAKKQAQTRLFSVLAEADSFDSEGKHNDCKGTLARARLLLGP